MQQRQNDIIANKRKLDLLKKELNQTNEQTQFKIPSPSIPSELSSRLNMSSVNYASVNTKKNTEIDFERKLQIEEHKKKLMNNNSEEDESNLSISDAYSNTDSIHTQDSKVMIKKKRKKKKKNKLNISTE